MSREVAEAIIKKAGSKKEVLKELSRQLIELAAHMACRKNMPSTSLDDMPFLDTATQKAKLGVVKMNKKADEQSRQWAIKTRQAANIAMILASEEKE